MFFVGLFFVIGGLSIGLALMLLYWGFSGRAQKVNKLLSLPVMILASLMTFTISGIILYTGFILHIMASLPH